MNDFEKGNRFLDLVKQQDGKFDSLINKVDEFDSVINKMDELSKSIRSYKREQIAFSIFLSIVFTCFTTAIVLG